MNVTYTTDRFNNPYQALALPGDGYYKLPDGVYINGDFTIIAWVRVHNVSQFNIITNYRLEINHIVS